MACVEGRVWLFGDDVSTDVMMPGPRVLSGNLQGRAAHEWCFETVRPGWSREVRPGDLIVAGRNFGCGSGRNPAPMLQTLGIAAVVVGSCARGFFRNSINSGLAIVTCPEAARSVCDGEQLRVDIATGVLTARSGLLVLHGAAIPDDSPPGRILAAGGFEPFVTALLAAGQRPDET